MINLPPATMITTAHDLAAHAAAWASEPLLALDTESNSLYVYHERVCLIQLSTRQQDFILDPLAMDDLSPLGALLADPGIEKVFHAAEYDVMCLKRDFGFTFARLFDTMVAARVCGVPQLGLGNMLAEHFGVHADKKHQRANWGTRPLSPELRRYAQLDTHYLPALRDYWLEQLQKQAHAEEAREVFAELADAPPAEHSFDPDAFWRVSGAQELSLAQMRLARELYLFREQVAERQDRPPFKIFGDRTLVALAEVAPRRLSDLNGVPGMTTGQIRRYGRGILAAIHRGEGSQPPSRPRSVRPDADTLARYEALKHWRKKRARQRGVESDVIVPRDALWALARRIPTTPDDLQGIRGFGPWKQQTYGEEILAVIARANGHR